MLLGVEQSKYLVGNWLVSKGEKLNEFSTKEIELPRYLRVRPKTLRIFERISIGEIALFVPALFLENKTDPGIILAAYTVSLIGVLNWIALRPFAVKNIQRSTHVLPLVGRSFQSIGNRLAA